MKVKYLILSFIVFFLASDLLLSQNSPVLEAYIQEAFSGNLAIKQQKTDLLRAQEAIHQARALYYPKVSFDANYTVAVGGRRIDFPIGDLLNPVYATLNQLTQSNAFPTLENQQIQFLPNNFHETKLSYSVPIYNTDLKYNRQIQNALYQTKALQLDAYKAELRYQISDTYLNYIKTIEAEKIWNSAQETLEELLRFNESLVKNNVATKEIVATAEYEIAKVRHEIVSLQNLRKTLQAYFNFLINKDLYADITVDPNILASSIPKEFGALSVQNALQSGMSARKELDVLASAQSAAELNVRRNEANRKIPDFYLGGSLGFQGYGYTFNKEQAYALAQIGLNYSLTDGGLQKSKTQEARLDAIKIEQQREEVQKQLQLQAIQANNEFETAYDLYNSNRFAVQSAESIFKITNNKYRAGQALLLEFLDAQNRVTQARLQQALSWNDVLLKAAALRRAVGSEN